MSLNWHQHSSSQTGAAVICSKHSHHHTSHVHHHHPTSISGFYLLVILFTQPGHQLSFIIIWPFCHLLGRSKTGVLCNAGRPSLLLIQHRSRDACAGTRGPSPACTMYPVPCPAEHLRVSYSLVFFESAAQRSVALHRDW